MQILPYQFDIGTFKVGKSSRNRLLLPCFCLKAPIHPADKNDNPDFFFLDGGAPTFTMADDFDTGDLFQDPEGFYPEEKQPTFAEHQMLSGQTVRVRLVGSHPLYVCSPYESPIVSFESHAKSSLVV